MGKEKSKHTEWSILLRGIMAALSTYLLGIFFLALLLSKGVLPERIEFPFIAVLCVLSTLISGLMVIGKLPFGNNLADSMVNAVIFGGLLIVLGAVCWQGITWTGHGGILIMCALGGGLLAGVMGKKRGGKKKKYNNMRARIR